VYGGGGIIPDIFVPLDHNYMLQYGYLNRFLSDFITDYLDAHLTELQSYTPGDFVKDEKIGNQLYNAFIKQHKGQVNGHKKHSSTQGKERLKRLMKALLARDLFGTNEYYQILIQDDPMLQKILKQPTENKGSDAK